MESTQLFPLKKGFNFKPTGQGFRTVSSGVVSVLSPVGPQHDQNEAWEIRIDKEADIVEVRQRVRELAKQCGFDQFAVAALTTAASELSRNIWVHAKKGIARIAVIHSGNRLGVELEFVDQGPGIADLERALAGGFSTAKSLGLGLSGTRRLVDEFNIDTEPGRGTKVAVRKWKREF
jgi:serine/threonine-protein kinase RsbT